MDSSHKHYMHIHQNKMKLLNGKTGTFVSSNKNPSNWEIYIPKPYWWNGVLTAGLLINRIPLKRSFAGFLSKCALLFPILLKDSRWTCFIHIPKQQWDKLDPKSIRCILLGNLSLQKKRYKCYLPGTKGKVFVTMNITFHKDVPCYSL